MGDIRSNCWNFNWSNILKKNKGILLNCNIPFFYLIFLAVNRHKAHMPINTSTYNKNSIYNYVKNLVRQISLQESNQIQMYWLPH